MAGLHAWLRLGAIAPVLLIIFGNTYAAIAQPIAPDQVPNPITPTPNQLPQPSLPNPSENLLQPPQVPPVVPNKLPDIPGTFTIKRFEFEGNTAIATTELIQATQEYTGKPISFAQLLEAEAIVTKLYTDRGYINSGAVIPVGKVQDGVVKIQVIEGELESIKVEGTQRLNPDYVRSRLAIATTKPLNKDRLLEALQLLRLDPLISGVSAELSAGTAP